MQPFTPSPQTTQIRFVFADQHGVTRGKTVNRKDFEQIVETGLPITSTLLLKDTSHKTVFQPFAGQTLPGLEDLVGGADFLLKPDLATATILPGAPHTLWVLCDGITKDGAALPYCSRQLLKRHLANLHKEGLDLLVGIELEFHIFKPVSGQLTPSLPGIPGPAREMAPLTRGSQYLTEVCMGQVEEVLEAIRQDLVSADIAPKSIELEFGASQVEMSFYPMRALAAADQTIVIRNLIKQTCASRGLHATFMCKPGAPATMASGWHLHQSIIGPAAANLFRPDRAGRHPLSGLGQRYAAGLLRHASATAILCCPTVNSFKRFQPLALAPTTVCWGTENRGALLRVVTTADGAGNHVENRIGDPTANPYLYIASQLVAGHLGIDAGYELPAESTAPYAAGQECLPASLESALWATQRDKTFYQAFGATFLDYLCAIKRAELARFLSAVTDWEQREYLELF